MDENELLGKLQTGLFIGGEWRDSSDGSSIDVEDPATGKTLTSVASASVADGKAALDAAVAAQADWAATAPRERAELLRSAFELITERADEFAMLMTLEMGKPLAQSKGEVTYGAEFFRWFSEEVVRIAGRWATSPDGNTRLMTMKQPVGPTLMITPWNFPLAMGTRKIGPAIAAGCTMVVKPARADPAHDAGARRTPRRGRASRGRAQRDLHIPDRRRDGADHRRLAAAQADLHRLHAGGKRWSSSPPTSCSGSRWSSAATRRSWSSPTPTRRRGRGRDAREDAQHGRGLHRGQPVHRARVGRRRVRQQVRRADGRRDLGRGTEDGVTVGPLIDAKQRDKVVELVEDALKSGPRC